MTDREKIDKLLDAGWEVHALVVPDCDKCCPVLRTVLTLESAWAEHEQAQYPKWCAAIEGAIVRIDGPNRRVTFTGGGPSVWKGDTSHLRGTRDQAVKALAEILRDPVVAAEGYGAGVGWRWLCRSGESELRMQWIWRVWNKDQCREEAIGTAPTEPAAREALAAWLLDNTMKEDKQ